LAAGAGACAVASPASHSAITITITATKLADRIISILLNRRILKN
jgi:hypothetical protein